MWRLRLADRIDHYVHVPFDGPQCKYKMSPGQLLDIPDEYLEGLSETKQQEFGKLVERGIIELVDIPKPVEVVPPPVVEITKPEPVATPWRGRGKRPK